ncbi:hypothetical protein MNBD_ALPHA11-2319 [hydrothermal vent metagenome]|uniref:Uncharacterized protein n=1 Tax=hydrothermal vent metagenome TaxID=652676 RepID=A0A3B0UTC2_9ZZZZ
MTLDPFANITASSLRAGVFGAYFRLIKPQFEARPRIKFLFKKVRQCSFLH